jgi:uncharacterized protein (TIGR03000 family)
MIGCLAHQGEDGPEGGFMKRRVLSFALAALFLIAAWASAQPSFPQGTGSMHGDRPIAAPAYYPPAYYPPAEATYESGYYGTRPEFVVPADAALIDLAVPANAEVWFSGEKTKATGEIRSFVTPALEKDRRFAYEVRVRWMENGKVKEKIEKLPVHAGDRLNLRFN